MDLRWLHFSDLHMGMTDGEPTLWGQARDALLDDLERMTQAHGPWDLVVFTGDLVQRGAKAEYEQLEESFLQPVWQRLGHPPPLLLAVPGNHDLVRPESSAHAQARIWSSSPEATLRSEEAVRNLSEWFGPYQRWWSEEERGVAAKDNYHEGILPGDWSFSLEKDGARYGFVGLNTAWTHWCDRAEGELTFSRRQLERAVQADGTARSWAEQHHLTFLLTHHPRSWLSETARMEFQQGVGRGRFFAHLFGHMHELTTQRIQLNEGDADAWSCQGASLFGLERFKSELNGAGCEIERRVGYLAGRVRWHDARTLDMVTWPRRGESMGSHAFQIVPDSRFKLELHELPQTPTRQVTGIRPWSEGEHESALHPLVTASEWSKLLEKSQLWARLLSTPGEEELRRGCLEVVRACTEVVKESTGSPDPWLDQELPIRVLRQVWRLEGSAVREPRLLALLIVAPFLREACLVAARTEASFENTLKETKSKFHGLKNHNIDNHSIDNLVSKWMMHQALLQQIRLFSSKCLTSLLDGGLGELVQALACSASIGGDSVCASHLIALALQIGADPRRLTPGSGRDPVAARGPAEELSGDLRAIGAILCVAGHLALDARRLDAAVPAALAWDGSLAEHLPGLFARARWSGEGQTQTLSLSCPHPCIDYAARLLVDAAQQDLDALKQLPSAGTAGPRLRQVIGLLPARLSPGGLAPAPGRPAYSLPHVRMRLEHERIRSLLLSEQLWGDPAVAVRELYQNALDACRYRRARMELLRIGNIPCRRADLQITVRQSQDASGRPYLECEDNGVGMARHHLQQLFSVAGRRFADDEEFLHDRSDWSAAGIRMFPNSRFGIGVLSYWLLADQVEVWTRRFERDGSSGDRLHVRVNSANGLFEIEECSREEFSGPGTRIRLWIPPERLTGGDGTTLSCRSFLSKILWFTEFKTVVEERGADSLEWAPGRLTIHKLDPDKQGEFQVEDFLEIPGESAWWCLGRQFRQGLVLIDGLLTEKGSSPKQERPFENPAISACYCLVNVTDDRLAEVRMKPDRSEVWAWPSAWLDMVASQHWEMLVQSGRLTLPNVLEIAKSKVAFAEGLLNAVWEMPLRLSTDDPPAGSSSTSQAKLQKLGFWERDPPEASGKDELPSIRRGASISVTHRAWRRAVWDELGLNPDHRWLKGDMFQPEASAPLARRHDAKILGALDSMGSRYREGAVRPRFEQVVRLARRTGLRLSEVCARWRDYRESRLAPDVTVPESWERLVEEVRDECAWRELDIRWLGALVDIDPSPVQGQLAALVYCAARRRRSLGQALEELRGLPGLSGLFPNGLEGITEVRPDEVDVEILSVFDPVGQQVPLNRVPVGHLLTMQQRSSLSPGEVWARASRWHCFGIEPVASWEEVQALQIDEDDLKLLRRSRQTLQWWEGELTGLEAWFTAQLWQIPPSQAAHRYAQLAPCGVHVSRAGLDWLAAIPTEDHLQKQIFPMAMVLDHNLILRRSDGVPALHLAMVQRDTDASKEELSRRLEAARAAGARVQGDWGQDLDEFLSLSQWQALRARALLPSAWHFALIALVESQGHPRRDLISQALRLERAGLLPEGARFSIDGQGTPLREIDPRTLAALVWAWRDRHPAEPPPSAEALFAQTRCLVWWEAEDELQRMTTGLAPILTTLERLHARACGEIPPSR